VDLDETPCFSASQWEVYIFFDSISHWIGIWDHRSSYRAFLFHTDTGVYWYVSSVFSQSIIHSFQTQRFTGSRHPAGGSRPLESPLLTPGFSPLKILRVKSQHVLFWLAFRDFSQRYLVLSQGWFPYEYRYRIGW
jgi:hypothetical protein